MEQSSGTDLEVKRSDFANDDVLSQRDELQIAVSSSSTLTFDRSSGPGNEIGFEQTGTIETVADKSTGEDIEEMPKLIEVPEPEKSRKNVKFNLRKSLAWDSAFFTNDGVLDADELSTMIEVGEKGAKHQLPGIEEEVYRSMDSISTLESDNLSLDCLEAELFVDIRASIQKSNKSFNLNDSSTKVSSGKKEYEPKVGSSSKKVDLDSGKRLAARRKDITLSIPQPKIINRLSSNLNAASTPTKRASLSANHAKKDQDIAKKPHVTQKGTQTTKPTTIQGSKVAGVTGPRRAVPKPSVSSKSSSLGSLTALKTDSPRPSSSSSSCSSGVDVKVNISRKKVESKSVKPIARSIIPKTPSRISMDNRRLPVTSNVSSSISPASSISDWSSESRGSSIDTSVSYRSFDCDTSVQPALSIHPLPRISNQTGSLSRPPTAQPTGLRMPSPKIGFFDGGKTGVKTPTGCVRAQSKLPNGPTSSNNVKYGKVPPPKSSVTNPNMKPNAQKTGPKPSQEQPSSKPKTKSSLVTSDVSDHKNETGLNICINPSHNVDEDSNKLPDSGNKDSEVPSNEPVMVGSEPKTKSSLVTSDVLDHKNETGLNICINPSHNVDEDSNKLPDLGNKVSEVPSNEPVTVGSRIPFAVMNSVSEPKETGVEVTEKTANIPFIESEKNENTEVV
ncbi:hypothetical protein SSX86_023627 [Deinandra increscens subsp. villosa]|uniref:Uncharacterized protein n=1 Tax=Deinandra increscens subsp. villosa TaxID=3103831 RepID=A0AAP0GSI7_9ASTR